MSGLFDYYLQCEACGLRGPQLSLVRNFPDRSCFLLPGADLEAGVLTATEVTIESREQLDDLAQLARELSTEARPVSVGLWRDDGVTLEPPLPCPSCGHLISRGRVSAPPLVQTEFARVADLVRATHERSFTGSHRFVSASGDIMVECIRDDDEGRPVNQWTVRRRSESADIAAVVEQLVKQLTETGHRCSTPKLKTRHARFTEWLGSSP